MTALELLDIRDVGREAWLNARKQGIGASDCAAALGLNKYKTPYQLWAEKTGIAAPVAENEAMRWGNLLEPVIASEFGDRTGLILRKNDKLFVSNAYPWLMGTPDYFTNESGVPGGVQIKNTGAYLAHDWEGGIPDAVHCQVEHEMAVTGFTFTYVVALVGGNKLVWHRIERDEAIIHALIGKLEAFWELVKTKTPPPLSSGDSDTMSALYPESTSGKHTVLSQSYAALCQDYLVAKLREKAATDCVDELAARLKAEVADAESARAGKYEITWKTQHRASYVAKATSFRKFTVKEAK